MKTALRLVMALLIALAIGACQPKPKPTEPAPPPAKPTPAPVETQAAPDPHDYTEKERNEFIRQLDKARAIIENHCMKDPGWFRCPRLTFEFDDQLEQSKNIEDLFRQIAKEKSDES